MRALQAFAALTHMEDVAVDAVMASLEACLAHLPHEMHAGVTPEASATVLAACPTPTVAPASSGSGAGVASEGGDNQLAMRTWLERCLPVLNGLVYTSSAGRRWLAASRKWRCGLAPLLRVFLVDVPVNVRVFAAFVMSNLSISREKELQDTVCCRWDRVWVCLVGATCAGCDGFCVVLWSPGGVSVCV